MGRAAENLHRERWLNSARPLFQKANVIFLGFTDAAERGSEADSDPILRFFLRIFDSGIIERQFCRRDRKLGVAIEPFQSMRREKFFRVPIIDLAGDPHTERAHIEIGDWADAGFLGFDPIPKTFDAFADAGNRAKAGDDNASSIHIITLFVRPSR